MSVEQEDSVEKFQPRGRKTGGGRGTVLLVDDEEMVLSVGGQMLSRLGFEVEKARDGREALERFRADPERFRFVLLDLTMPHMDGAETFRELRATHRDVKVVLSSGYNEQELNARFAGQGVTAFVQKPYRLRDLTEVIERALGPVEPEAE